MATIVGLVCGVAILVLGTAGIAAELPKIIVSAPCRIPPTIDGIIGEEYGERSGDSEPGGHCREQAATSVQPVPADCDLLRCRPGPPCDLVQ
jgi:hypothetical protein